VCGKHHSGGAGGALLPVTCLPRLRAKLAAKSYEQPRRVAGGGQKTGVRCYHGYILTVHHNELSI
jgi:hypothetical protein